MHRTPGRRRIQCFRAALRARRRGRRLTEALFDGLFLGLMDRETLAALDRAFFSTAQEDVGDATYAYTDEIHVRSGLAAWETAALESLRPGARVVVTGAGAGREVLALLAAGYDAVGYEPHDGLVAAGVRVLERAGHPGRLLPSPRDVFPADAGRADGVLVGWGSYMLLPGRARRVAFLSAARRALAPGDPLVLSFFPRVPERRDRIVAAVANVLRRLRGDEPVEVGDALVPNFVHRFTRAELESELAEAGFACERFAAEPYGHAVARALALS
jgi:hypothetical protein